MKVEKKKRVVVIGGGTGTFTLLRGLKKRSDTLHITAIVTMADSGGSTGRLRDEFGYLPVGDVRMALTALAEDCAGEENLLRQLFMHRFNSDGAMSGHSFGNLFLVALTDILGSEHAAIEAAGKILRIQGKVVPVTTDTTDLVATFSGGARKIGEHTIDVCDTSERMERITCLELATPARVTDAARDAILHADLIVLGPGDLYTSILANIVVDGVPVAVQSSKGSCVYVSNLMSRAGQTNGMGVQDYIQEIERYTRRPLDAVLINTSELPDELVSRYALQGEYPVVDNVRAFTGRVVRKDFLADECIETVAGDRIQRSLLRHDPEKLTNAIMELL